MTKKRTQNAGFEDRKSLFFFFTLRADLIWAADDGVVGCLCYSLLVQRVVSLQLYCCYLTFCHFTGLPLKCCMKLNVNKTRTKERRGECHPWEVTAIRCAVYRTWLILQPQMLGKNKLPDTARCQKQKSPVCKKADTVAYQRHFSRRNYN